MTATGKCAQPTWLNLDLQGLQDDFLAPESGLHCLATAEIAMFYNRAMDVATRKQWRTWVRVALHVVVCTLYGCGSTCARMLSQTSEAQRHWRRQIRVDLVTAATQEPESARRYKKGSATARPWPMLFGVIEVEDELEYDEC
jgi:hypothetical protein